MSVSWQGLAFPRSANEHAPILFSHPAASPWHPAFISFLVVVGFIAKRKEEREVRITKKMEKNQEREKGSPRKETPRPGIKAGRESNYSVRASAPLSLILFFSAYIALSQARAWRSHARSVVPAGLLLSQSLYFPAFSFFFPFLGTLALAFFLSSPLIFAWNGYIIHCCFLLARLHLLSLPEESRTQGW